MLASARQQEIWARLKAENHPYYTYVLGEAAKDNTPAMRYASLGRWSALAYAMSGDATHARRAYETQSAIRKDWGTAAVLTGNDLREFGTELAVMLDWIRPALSSDEVALYLGWLKRVAENIFVSVARLNDSDQVVGNYFFLAAMDRAFETDYTTRTLTEDLRGAVIQFCTVYGAGGQWPESSDYNLGTLYLLFNGADVVGLDAYPEVNTFRDQYATQFIQQFTPDLKDTFEWGDDQTPNALPWQSVEDLCAYLGHYHAALRGFEETLRAAKNKPYGTSFYARYFHWADPFGPRSPWTAFAGDVQAATGVGQVHARTGWAAADHALMIWFPSFSIGELDHCYYNWGAFRWYGEGQFFLDQPSAYSASVELANQTILAGLGGSTEVGLLTGWAHHPGELTYASGTNAGLNVTPKYYQPPATYRHELTRSLFHFWDRETAIIIDRVCLDDPQQLPGFARYAAATQIRIKTNPLVQTLWHSQTVLPVVTNGVIEIEATIRPLYPATFTVVDMAAMNVGTIVAKEKKWFVRVVPESPSRFQVLSTLITLREDVTATVEQLGDVQRIRVVVPGFPDVWIYSSVLPGPTLATSLSGAVSFHDPSKITGILTARTLNLTPIEVDGDIIVETADGITYTPAVVKPPVPPTEDEWVITAQDPDARIVLERTSTRDANGSRFVGRRR